MPIQRWSEAIWLIKLGEEPALSEDLLGARAEAAAQSAMPHLVLDMAAIPQLNSSNLSQLLRLRKLAIDRDRRLILAAMPEDLWAVFLATGLDKVFHFCPDVPSALAQLQMR